MFGDLFQLNPVPRRKSSKVRDSQRRKMYQWESKLEAQYVGMRVKLTPQEAQSLVTKIFTSENMRVPDVFMVKNRQGFIARYWNYDPKTGKSSIEITPRGLTLCTILHEIAHGVRYKYTDKNKPEAAHGPTFIRVYMDLLVKYAKLDITELRRTAKEAKLKVAPKPDYTHAFQPMQQYPQSAHAQMV